MAELQQPEPGGAVIVQAKKMPQAPEGAVRGGGIFPHHMQDQLQRKQHEQLLQALPPLSYCPLAAAQAARAAAAGATSP